MNKEEILAKSRAENRGRDEADREAQRKGTWLAYLIGMVGMILVNLINGAVLKRVNHGANAVICLMTFVAFFVKYRALKKRHELIVALVYGALTLLFLVLWLLQLLKVL